MAGNSNSSTFAEADLKMHSGIGIVALECKEVDTNYFKMVVIFNTEILKRRFDLQSSFSHVNRVQKVREAVFSNHNSQFQCGT